MPFLGLQIFKSSTSWRCSMKLKLCSRKRPKHYKWLPNGKWIRAVLLFMLPPGIDLAAKSHLLDNCRLASPTSTLERYRTILISLLSYQSIIITSVSGCLKASNLLCWKTRYSYASDVFFPNSNRITRWTIAQILSTFFCWETIWFWAWKQYLYNLLKQQLLVRIWFLWKPTYDAGPKTPSEILTKKLGEIV